jgi:hypothetical protein
MTPSHAWIPEAPLCNASSRLAWAAKSPPRKSGYTPTTCRAETAPAATELGHRRPTLLGRRAASLVGLEAVPGHRYAGDCGPLAPSGFPSLLDVGFENPEAGGEKTGPSAGTGPELPQGRREPDLGRTSHPR